MASTTRYQEWIQCVQDGAFLPSNNRMNVKLVADTYVPDESHHIADVQDYIVNGVYAIVDDYFSANPMSNILDKVKSKLEEGFAMFPTEIGQEIDRIFDAERAEKLKQLIQSPSNNLWMDLKENGIGYFVFEFPELSILTFTEPL